MTDYYVNSASTGSGDGTTQDIAGANAAWKHHDEVNGLVAGDTVHFNRGDEFYGEFRPTWAGTAENRITYTAYGTGALPILSKIASLLGWDTPGNWTEDGTNHWKFDLHIPSVRCWIDSKEALRAQNGAALTPKYNYALDAILNLVWVYSVGNPATTFEELELGTVVWSPQSVFLMDYCHYTTVSYLDIRGGFQGIYLYHAHHVIIEYCVIGIGCRTAISLYAGDFGILRYNVIDSLYRLGDNGDFNRSRAYFGREGIYSTGDITRWDIHHNVISNFLSNIVLFPSVYTTTNFDIHHNDISGAAITYCRGFVTNSSGTGVCSGHRFYNNDFHHLTTRSQLNALDMEVYYNVFRDNFKTDCGHGWDTDNYARCQGILIQSDYSPAQRSKIYNNVFANIPEAGVLFENPSYTSEGHEIINNIFYNCASDPFEGTNPWSLWVGDYSDYADLVIKNNCFYQPGVTDMFRYRGVICDIDEFNAIASDGDVIEGNFRVNPAFVKSTGKNFSLTISSLCRDAGIDVSRTTDYDGKAILGIPDVGAFESQFLTIESSGKYGVPNVVNKFGGDGLNKYGVDKISTKYKA